MQSLSNSLLSSLSFWLQWVAIIGICLGLLAALGLLFVNKETSSRFDNRLSSASSEATTAKELAGEIRSNQQPRILEQAQYNELVSEFLLIKDALELAIVYASGDKEAEGLAKQLSSAFHDAGIDHLTTWWTGSSLPIEVSVLSRHNASDDDAYAISQALNKSSLSVQYMRGALIPDKNISVIIGAKK